VGTAIDGRLQSGTRPPRRIGGDDLPVQKVDVPSEIPYIQILDKDGNVDEELEPDIPDDDLLDLYETMVLSRMFDERRERLQRQGRIGTFAPSFGQEAAQLGSIYATDEDDWMVQSYRELTANLWRGMRLQDDLIYAAGYERGMELSPEDRQTPIAIPIASQVCQATGIAWADRLKDEDRATIVYFGDGSTSEGDFHEGMNFAGVFDAPTVFFCQNNQWAISVPRDKQTAADTLAQKAIGYGIPGMQVDGNDILGVYHATKKAVEDAKNGEGPTMIEALTYRMSFHTTADDPSVYRDEEEVEPWRERDPIDRLEIYLEDRNILDDERKEEIREAHDERISQAVDDFEERAKELGDPEDMFDHAYAEEPAYLTKQREEMTRYWRENDIWGDHHG
jgi:pyruvate dehydrogenase E1 component alpha subunit